MNERQDFNVNGISEHGKREANAIACVPLVLGALTYLLGELWVSLILGVLAFVLCLPWLLREAFSLWRLHKPMNAEERAAHKAAVERGNAARELRRLAALEELGLGHTEQIYRQSQE